MTLMSAARHLVATARVNTVRSRAAPSVLKIVRPQGTLAQPPTLFIRRIHGYPHNYGHLARPMARAFSWTSIPRFVVSAVRAPIAAATTAVVGGAAYAEYKAKKTWNDVKESVSDAFGWFGDKVAAAKGAVQDQYDKAKDTISGIEFGSGKESEGESQGEEKGSEEKGAGGGEAVAAAAVAAAAVTRDDADEDQMMLLTKKMIEIRGILQQVDQTDTLQLPSIVVIGSQSSGKSSVLEAIVGHEFLPKGSNMVTRRPIELTLINTPESAAEYCEFPALGLGKLTDFAQVQRTLTDLNLAVPETEAVSDDPIQLNIYSPHVPDLTMIDLPGYIQVASSDQPGSIKQKINSLCEKYIQAPNIILAISAADVDLANSSALKASRRIDPRGERTIGVITKMDLVEPSRGSSVLHNKNYPLQMGYVGVITRAPPSQSVGLFRSRSSSTITSIVAQNEQNFFSQYPSEYSDCTVGTLNLRDKLMRVLESTMARSLQPTSDAIHQELEEATYMFKVEYNDRYLTPQTYLAQSLDAFKLEFKDLSKQLGRNEVKKILKSEFDQRVLDLLAQRYWNKPILDEDYSKRPDPPLSGLPQAAIDDLYWNRKLDASTSALTKLGVGRLSTNLVINTLTNEMERLVDSTTFRNHPFARDSIHEATTGILNSRFYSTSEQVENCIKPYKFEVEVEDREWSQSRDHAYNLLKEELRQCDDAYESIKRQYGNKKIKKLHAYVDSVRDARRDGRDPPPPLDSEGYQYTANTLKNAYEAAFLHERADILKLRMAAVKSRQCKSKDNKYYCPEVFLDVVAEKLTQTAVLFLNVELLSDFYYNFPRELDHKLGKNLTDQQVEVFAKEDPKIRKHIELQQRKELLELALEKIEAVIELQKSQRRD